ncbi:MAG: divergent polysaccharide deacetylase family protein [Deltaproteobacteria bacterium]|nr:divergent polysaccharide deacetylase family protein [Deltaproteobacteria bacterium]
MSKRRNKGEKGLFQDWKKALVFALLPFCLGIAAAIIYLYPGDSARVKSLERVEVQTEKDEQELVEDLMEEEKAGDFLEGGLIKGKISLVLDDVGYEKDRTLKFINMGVPVTISILPGGQYSRELATVSARKGNSVLLHMPMQSEKNVTDKTSEFLITVDMGEKEIIDRLDRALSWVPGACGISNHMGSRFTKSSEGMRYVALYLKKRQLFFLDSKTTAQSVAPFVFRVTGVKTIVRDIFIDNDDDPAKIVERFEELKEIAFQNGMGIGIMHPGSDVVDLIEKLVRESLFEGYRFVTLSDLLAGS